MIKKRNQFSRQMKINIVLNGPRTSMPHKLSFIYLVWSLVSLINKLCQFSRGQVSLRKEKQSMRRFKVSSSRWLSFSLSTCLLLYSLLTLTFSKINSLASSISSMVTTLHLIKDSTIILERLFKLLWWCRSLFHNWRSFRIQQSKYGPNSQTEDTRVNLKMVITNYEQKRNCRMKSMLCIQVQKWQVIRFTLRTIPTFGLFFFTAQDAHFYILWQLYSTQFNTGIKSHFP